MRRIVWLTTLALVASCGGDPAPKDVENPATVHRKKKKKKKPVEVAAAKDDDAAAPESKEDKRKKQDEEDAKEAEERRERQRKREQEEAAKEADEQAVSSDQGGDSSESSDDSEKKSDDEDDDKKKEAAEDKKRKKEEAAEKKKEAAEEKKRKKEEAAEKKKEAAEAQKRKKEEAAEEAKAKKEAVAEEAKAKKDKKKHSEDAEEASSDDESAAKSDDESSDEDEQETKKADKKKGKGKAKKTVAAKDKKADKKKKKKDEDEDAKDEEAKDDEAKEDKGKADKEVAKADEPEEDDSKSNLPPPDPENESKELDLEGGAVPKRDDDEAPQQVAMPLAIDRRPLTEPKGKFDAHGGLRVAAITTTGPGAGGKMISTTSTSEGFGLGATYGVSDSIQVGIDYTLGLHPGSAKGPLSLAAAFRVTHSEKLDIALSAGFAIDYLSTTDVTKVPPVTTTETLKGLQFGVWARYHLGPKMSAFTGLPATPGTATGLAGASGGLPPLPYHLSIGLGSKAAIAMELPVGFAYQASPKLYTFAMTSLGHLGMNNSSSAFIFADYIPFSVGGFYANDTKLDFGAVLSDDVKQGLGYLRFDVVARYYLK